MMLEKSKALLVEDSVSFCSVLTGITADKADWTICPDLASARKCLNENNYSIIVLDLYLPDGNSIPLCEEIRANSNQQYPTVVFISGEEKLEWRLRTYEVGADDFIIKNINAEELLLKFDTLFAYQSRRRLVADAANREITEITGILSKDSENNAKLLSFCRLCLNITSTKQMGAVITDFLAYWNLDFCLQVKNHDSYFRLKYDGSDFSPMEDELFLKLSENNSNIQTFGHKTYFRKDGVELIIQNMPVDDEYATGTLKDILHIALCILNDKRKHLELVFQTAREYDVIEKEILNGNMDNALTAIGKLKSLIAEDESVSTDNTSNDDIVFF